MKMINQKIDKRELCAIVICCVDFITLLSVEMIHYDIYSSHASYGVIRVIVASTLILYSILAIYVFHVIFNHYYERRSEYDEIVEVLNAFLFINCLSLSTIYIFKLSDTPMKHINFFFSIPFIVMFIRFLTRKILNKLNLWMLDCMIISLEGENEYVVSALLSQFNLGLKISSTIKIDNKYLNDDYELVYLYKKIDDGVKEKNINDVVISLNGMSSKQTEKIINYIEKKDIKFHLIPDFGGMSLQGMQSSHFFKSEVLIMTPIITIEKRINQITKRLFDISIALVALLFLCPLLVSIYAILSFSNSSPIYCHIRYGRRGKFFKCYKFKTMYDNSDIILNKYFTDFPEYLNEWKDTHKLKKDPRVTPIGKFLRVYSLDELPQLYNVLIGDMSIIGPRPITEAEIPKYSEMILWYEKVRPGITGLWQISGRNLTTYQERVALDVWYIKNWSAIYDVAIFIRTIIVVLRRHGAY